jgi:D-alanyl-D-alanine carboxypeptidase
MKANLDAIHQKLGITEQELSKNKLQPCNQPRLNDLAVADIDWEGKPFILLNSAAKDWQKMQAAARSEEILLQPYSGFRSYLYQQRLIEKRLKDGRTLENILTHIAIPGFSEHHSGRAIDIYTNNHAVLEEAFEKTPAYQWLTEKAENFHFRLSYPRGNQWGIIFEPWHWYYHG